MKYYEIDFKIAASEELMQDSCDLVAALACDAGFETFEESEEGVKGYVQQALFDKETLDDLLNDFPIDGVQISYSVAEAEDKDWNEQWENEGFEPIVLGNKCAIHDGRHLPEGDFETTVEIDAKLAFGTGTHETTQMIVDVLTDMDVENKAILDCGCGTGILGIVALKRGAKAAVGYDIDEWSTNNSVHNAIINMVDNRYEALLGDSSVLNAVEQRFDIVVANINRNILLGDMPQFNKMLKQDGTLILSGFYEADIEMLAEKAKEYGLQVMKTLTANDWACMVLTR